MRIYNPTGNAEDTMVYDEYGYRIMGITKIKIGTIEANRAITAEITFENVKLDFRTPDDNVQKIEETLWVPPTDEQKQAYIEGLNYGIKDKLYGFDKGIK